MRRRSGKISRESNEAFSETPNEVRGPYGNEGPAGKRISRESTLRRFQSLCSTWFFCFFFFSPSTNPSPHPATPPFQTHRGRGPRPSSPPLRQAQGSGFQKQLIANCYLLIAFFSTPNAATPPQW